MDVWATMDQRMGPRRVPGHARRVEALGYTGLLVPEAVHDGFGQALLALEHTERLRVATSVVVAFARSPTVTAHAAWDLQALSGGRFELGLGSQVKGNLEGRYGVSWSPPAPRMREYVAALRAVWDCWQHGRPLAFEGRHYRLTRMQPFFVPEPLERPHIPVHLAAVGPQMTRLAGEVADGVMLHPTNASPRAIEVLILPELERGAARSARRGSEVAVLASGFVATGPDLAAVRGERERIRAYLGFLYSTPAYRPTLELFGWQEVGVRLRELSRERRWQDMPALVDDAMLDALVPSGPYAEIADVLRAYAGLATGVAFPLPADPAHDASARQVIESLRGTAG